MTPGVTFFFYNHTFVIIENKSMSINYKRVAEVWMDEYKEFLYARDPEKFKNIETGDLSYQLSVKKRNKCKPFKHFIENVAPDLVERYPLVEPPPFASGAVRHNY